MFLRKITTGVIVAALICSMSVPALAASGYRDKDPGKTGADNFESSYVPSSTGGSTTLTSTDAASRVAEAVNSGKGSVSITNTVSVSASTVKAMFNAAGDNNLTVHFDQVNNGVVTSRIYVTPDIAESLVSEVRLGVNVNNTSVTSFFNKYFTNNVTSIKFEQDGSFGANVAVAVKADLSGMDTSNLVFYTYDAATNTYKILDVEYTVDANGYLRFTTPVGGNVVISEGVLTK